jgi:flagellar FliL protein
MTTVTAAQPAEPAAPAKGSRKKMLVVVAALVAVLLAAGAAAVLWLQHRAQAEAEAEADETEAAPDAAVRRDPKAVPVFVALESFTVNLADREADRYAQIGISLELNDAATAERIKVFMPAIRNNILMVLSHKRSAELLERAGKEKLAAEVQRETERALGVDPPPPGKKGPNPSTRPIRAVHFSNFIIQ